jgi:ABC-type amino acid transport substrate-binding protein
MRSWDDIQSPATEIIRTLFPVEQLETRTPGKLVVGYTGDPPTDWIEDGRLIGLHGEVRQKVADVLGLQIEAIQMPWPAMIGALTDNIIDLPGLGTAWTPEREKTFAITQPYQYYFLGVFERSSRLNSPGESSTGVDFSALRHERVGTIAAGWNLPELEGTDGWANVIFYNSLDEIVAGVITERIDVGVYDLPNVKVALANRSAQGEYCLRPFNFDAEHPLTTGRFPIHFLFRREAIHLRAAADLALDLLKTSGELLHICQRYGFGDELLYICG